MAVPRLGVKSELQLLAYATTTAPWDLSCICDLCHSSWQHWILNPLNEARDRTHVLMDASQRLNCLTLIHGMGALTVVIEWDFYGDNATECLVPIEGALSKYWLLS